MRGAVKSLLATWRVEVCTGGSYLTSMKKRSHLDDDEASVTKKARVEGPLARRMRVHDENST